MKSELFSNFIQKPQSLSSHHTGDLESIIKEYPYFQSARAIHLKALKNNDSSNYNDALKVTAAYTTDRSILFDFITSDGFRQNEISQHIKKHYENIKDLVVSSENVSVKKSIAIDDALKQQVSESVNILDPDLFQPKVEKSKIVSFKLNQEEEIKEQDQTSKSSSNPTPEELLNLGAPLQFDFKEKHSFNEWLKLTKFKPIERKNDPGTSVESEDSKSLSENDSKSGTKLSFLRKLLIQSQDEKSHLDIDRLTGNLFTFFAAGTETAMNTLCICLFILAGDKGLQEKIASLDIEIAGLRQTRQTTETKPSA